MPSKQHYEMKEVRRPWSSNGLQLSRGSLQSDPSRDDEFDQIVPSFGSSNEGFSFDDGFRLTGSMDSVGRRSAFSILGSQQGNEIRSTRSQPKRVPRRDHRMSRLGNSLELQSHPSLCSNRSGLSAHSYRSTKSSQSASSSRQSISQRRQKQSLEEIVSQTILSNARSNVELFDVDVEIPMPWSTPDAHCILEDLKHMSRILDVPREVAPSVQRGLPYRKGRSLDRVHALATIQGDDLSYESQESRVILPIFGGRLCTTRTLHRYSSTSKFNSSYTTSTSEESMELGDEWTPFDGNPFASATDRVEETFEALDYYDRIEI